MNLAYWILAGALLGWLSYVFRRAVGGWGLAASILIGAVGGFAGGNVLAPMLGASREAPNEFSFFSMVIALVCAAGLLAVGKLVSKRTKG